MDLPIFAFSYWEYTNIICLLISEKFFGHKSGNVSENIAVNVAVSKILAAVTGLQVAVSFAWFSCERIWQHWEDTAVKPGRLKLTNHIPSGVKFGKTACHHISIRRSRNLTKLKLNGYRLATSKWKTGSKQLAVCAAVTAALLPLSSAQLE